VTRGEVARLLTFAATFDQRTIGEADVLAWYALLAPKVYDDAMESVRRWYADHRDRIMPADVLAGIRAIGNQRTALAHDRRRQLEAGRAVPPPPAYAAAREAFGQLPAGVSDVQRVGCPWCHARAGTRCTPVGGEGTLSVTYAHPARYVVAGAGAPRVDADALAARKGGAS